MQLLSQTHIQKPVDLSLCFKAGVFLLPTGKVDPVFQTVVKALIEAVYMFTGCSYSLNNICISYFPL